MRMSGLVGHFVLYFEVPALDYTGASDSNREYHDSNMDLAGRTLLPNGDIRCWILVRHSLFIASKFSLASLW